MSISDTMKITPVVLLASERSGTNLLRAMMLSHSEIASPPPCSLIDVLPKMAARYFPAFGPSHKKELIEDAILLSQSHLNPWDIPLDSRQIEARMKDDSIWSLFSAMNEIYAESEKAICWFSKEPGLFRHIYEIALHIPNARFIYMVRDGRDVAASMLKGGLHATHIYEAASHWSNNQRLCLAALADESIRSRTLLVRYEDIISSPEEYLKLVMNHVGLEFQEKQLSFYQNKEVIDHSNKSEFWQNLAKPIKRDNSGGYRNMLSARDIRLFEAMAGEEMERLQYPLDYPRSRCYPTLSMKAYYRIMGKLRKISNRRLGGREAKRHEMREQVQQRVLNRSFD